MGKITFRTKDLHNQIDKLSDQFRVDQYNIFTHNCNHFSKAFVYALTGKHIPNYVTRGT